MSEQSRYCYPGTDILMNHADLRDERQLKQFETIVTQQRIVELQLNRLNGNFDLAHLQNIHRHIFQDVYPFAGKIRTEDIAKDTFRFAPMQFIESSGNELMQALSKEKLLNGLPIEKFAQRAAHYMAEINVLHPFREGNGRSNREFIGELAEHNHFTLDWDKVDKADFMGAAIRSTVDTRPLTQVIQQCLAKKAEPFQ